MYNGWTLYADGTSHSTWNSTENILTNQNTVLGGDDSVTGSNMVGRLDQVRIFNTALDSTQVTSLYNEVACPCTTNNTAYPTTNLANYKLDGDADDSTNNYNGTASNVSWVQGKFGAAGSFNGSSSRIVTGVTPATGSGQFSVSGWVNVDSLSAIRGVFSTIVTPGTDRLGFTVHVLTNGKVRALVYDSAGAGIIESTDLISAGTWHHIVFTYSNGLSKIAVDGNVQASTVNQLITGYYDSINIGRYYASITSLSMLGKIDQVRIFNTALSANEITDLYDEQYCFDNFFNDDSTVATYKLNNTALDDLGLYNGTPSSITYAAGKFNEAAVFNGSSSKIVPSSSPIPSSGAFTVSAWVKTSVSNHCFISFGDFWLNHQGFLV
jgi:hypothetical protein